ADEIDVASLVSGRSRRAKVNLLKRSLKYNEKSSILPPVPISFEGSLTTSTLDEICFEGIRDATDCVGAVIGISSNNDDFVRIRASPWRSPILINTLLAIVDASASSMVFR